MSGEERGVTPPGSLGPSSGAVKPMWLAVGALAIAAASVAGTLAFTGKLRASAASEKPGCAQGEAHEEGGGHLVELTDAARENAHLEIGEAGPGKVWTTVTMPGEVALDADRLAHVTPRISGVAREVRKQLGDDVKKGEILATLESRELADLTREARASAERTKLAQANFDRLDALFAQGVVAQKEQLAAKTELQQAKIAEEAASQALAAAGSGGGGASYPLKAPIDGTIIEKHVTTGEVLKDDTLVFVVADLSSVWIDLSVYAKDLPRVSVGQDVRIRADGIDAPAHGTISFLGATATSDSRTTMARIILQKPGEEWRPGLFVSADVAIASVEAPIVVDDEAVQTLDGKSVVFVEVPGGFDAREVKLGSPGRREDGTNVVAVAEGLEKGARYAKKNAFVLKAELGKGAAHDDD